jgi:hypothetical protein
MAKDIQKFEETRAKLDRAAAKYKKRQEALERDRIPKPWGEAQHDRQIEALQQKWEKERATRERRRGVLTQKGWRTRWEPVSD